MRKVFIYVLVVAITSCGLPDGDLFAPGKSKLLPVAAMKAATGIDGPLKTDTAVLQRKIKSVLKKASTEDYDTHYALLADLGLHSGSKRLYLIDLSVQQKHYCLRFGNAR